MPLRSLRRTNTGTSTSLLFGNLASNGKHVACIHNAEVMVLSDPLKDLVLQGASTAELKTEAIRLGMCTLRRSGLNKINEGTTTVEEILRVTAAD